MQQDTTEMLEQRLGQMHARLRLGIESETELRVLARA